MIKKIFTKERICLAILFAAFISISYVSCRRDVFPPQSDVMGYFIYTVLEDGNSVSINQFTGFDEIVDIPAYIHDMQVTTIDNQAFIFYNRGIALTDVSIPDSVLFINHKAFSGNRLSHVDIPDNVIKLGRRSFSYNLLTSVSIPDSVTYIGMEAFFFNFLSDFNIPDTVTHIGKWAFGYNLFTDITIPESITNIKEGTFAYNLLSNVTIPGTVTRIGRWSFYNNELNSITIPDSVTFIGAFAFMENDLKNITIGDNVNLAVNSFSSFPFGFGEFYNRNGQRAGTYIFTDGIGWTFNVR